MNRNEVSSAQEPIPGGDAGTGAGRQWTARFSGYSNGWTIYGRDDDGEYLVAENIGPYADDEKAEAEAEREARLIAAAPDLLEALASIAAMTNADDSESYRADDREGCLDAVSVVARAAIAKATGAGA